MVSTFFSKKTQKNITQFNVFITERIRIQSRTGMAN